MPGTAFFSPGDECLKEIVRQFRNCRRTADLCVFTITDDRIANQILDAHGRGVRMRIVTDNLKAFDRGSDIARFQEAGIPLRIDATDAHMHHKFAIFDGVRLLNGSYNWTRSAALENEENIIVTDDPSLITAFSRQFESIWNNLA